MGYRPWKMGTGLSFHKWASQSSMMVFFFRQLGKFGYGMCWIKGIGGEISKLPFDFCWWPLALLTMVVVHNGHKLANIDWKSIKCYATALVRCMSLNLVVGYADFINFVVLQEDSPPLDPLLHGMHGHLWWVILKAHVGASFLKFFIFVFKNWFSNNFLLLFNLLFYLFFYFILFIFLVILKSMKSLFNKSCYHSLFDKQFLNLSWPFKMFLK